MRIYDIITHSDLAYKISNYFLFGKPYDVISQGKGIKIYLDLDTLTLRDNTDVSCKSGRDLLNLRKQLKEEEILKIK